jgi:hypothetical protein
MYKFKDKTIKKENKEDKCCQLKCPLYLLIKRKAFPLLPLPNYPPFPPPYNLPLPPHLISLYKM